MAVMVVELYEALREAGASEQEAQAAAQAPDYNARFDKLEIEFDTGLAEVRARITMLKWMNGIVIGGVAALIINTFFA